MTADFLFFMDFTDMKINFRFQVGKRIRVFITYLENAFRVNVRVCFIVSTEMFKKNQNYIEYTFSLVEFKCNLDHLFLFVQILILYK